MFMLGSSILDYVIFSNLFTGGATPELMMYIGDLTVLVINLVSAAWIAVKTVEQAISFSTGFYFQYGNGSAFGNYIGATEIFFVVLYLATSMVITGLSIFGAMMVWELLDGRMTAVANEGKYGHAVSWPDVIKYGALGMILSIGTWTTAWAIGETIDNTVGWFNDWMDATTSKTEGSDKDNGLADPYGTSLQFDSFYHNVMTLYAWFTQVAIMAGAWVFAFLFMSEGFGALQGCDLAEVEESTYADVRTLIASKTNLETCKKAMLKLFRIADLDKSGMIDRCENAKFLYGIGNTQDYALNYNQIMTIPYFYSGCMKQFPETKDYMHDDKDD